MSIAQIILRDRELLAQVDEDQVSIHANPNPSLAWLLQQSGGIVSEQFRRKAHVGFARRSFHGGQRRGEQ